MHGPDSLTGEGVARTWNRNLGQEVHYGGDDLDAWEQQARQMMPAWMVHHLRIMYQYFQERSFNASVPELAKLRKG